MEARNQQSGPVQERQTCNVNGCRNPASKAWTMTDSVGFKEMKLVCPECYQRLCSGLSAVWTWRRPALSIGMKWPEDRVFEV